MIKDRSDRNTVVMYLNTEQKSQFLETRGTVVAAWFKKYGVKPANADILESAFRLLHDTLTKGRQSDNIRQNLYKYERIRTSN